jgi:pilus assembly protein CpaE
VPSKEWQGEDELDEFGSGNGQSSPHQELSLVAREGSEGWTRTGDDRTRGRHTRVILGIHDMGLHQEVLDLLERDSRVEVLAALSDPERLVRAVIEWEPDATVVCPTVAREMRHPALIGRSAGTVLVAQEMTVPILREAIDAGALAVYAWPEERKELAMFLSQTKASRVEGSSGRGRVIAVFGARGGAGTTFVATHLAAALTDCGRRSVLVDLDASFADVTVALGVGPNESVRTVADLLPVVDELEPEHLDDALFKHPRGFSVLFAPAEENVGARIPPGLYSASVALLAGVFDEVVLHIPRRIDNLARIGVGMADEVVLVVTLDLFSLYGARRSMAALHMNEPIGRCRVVVNRLGRADVAVRDVRRVLGVPAAAIVRFDPKIPRVQARGALLSPKARRAGRDLRFLARLVANRPPLSTVHGGV